MSALIEARQAFAHPVRLFEGKAENPTDRADLFTPDGGARGQHEYPFEDVFGDRQEQTRLRIIGPVGFHPMAAGIEVPPGEHVFRVEDSHQLIATEAGFGRVNLGDEVLVVMFFVVVVLEQPKSGQ